jgi:hypothetical protein
MHVAPSVFKDEPTTQIPVEEIGALNDDELLDFCEVHCWTPEAKFHRSTVRRLFRLAGSLIDCDRMPEWIVARPAIMNVLVQTARSSLGAGRRRTGSVRHL